MATLGVTEGYWTAHIIICHHFTEKPSQEPQRQTLIQYANVFVCLCSHPGGLEVTDKSASGPINNSYCPDSALTINTPRALCFQGGVNSWVDYFTLRKHLGTSETGEGIKTNFLFLILVLLQTSLSSQQNNPIDHKFSLHDL